LKKAEETSFAINDKQVYAMALQSIAGIYTNNTQYDSALIYLNKCIELFTEINYLNGLGEIYNGMGVLYKRMNKDSLALEYHFKAYKIFTQTENIKQLSNSFYNIASLNFFMHKSPNKTIIQQSLKYLDSCLYYTQKINYGEAYADIYKLRSDLFEALSELSDLPISVKFDYLKKSLNDFKNYKLYADSIFNSEIVENTARQQIQFEFDKKEAILKEQQEKERQIANARQKQNKIIIWSVLTVLILMFVFSIFIVNRYKITRQQKSIIEHQKKMVEEKQKEILDSIQYAKRIQMALLTNEYYIDKNLKRLLK
jgi:tetratricopeptide (TPR) repeat protein